VATLAGAPAQDADMDIAISLKLRDEAGLDALLRAIYTPGSPAWRHYVSVAEFTARFGPTQADYATLLAFAAAHHLQPRHLSANRLVLDLHGRVADIENALHLKMGLYRQPAQARLFYAPDREPNPDIALPILHISGLDNAMPPMPHAVHGVVHTDSTGSGPLGNFIGSDLRAAYYGGTTRTGAGQSLALVEYAGYNPVDISNYFLQVHQTNKVPIKGVSLNGISLSCTGTCSDFEQSLDIETALSIAPGLTQLVLYVGDTDVSILNQIAVDNSSKQISSSWGWPADATTLDPIFKEYAAQGQSYFNASGDQGDHLLAGGVWPSDDQYVTGVGGTDLGFARGRVDERDGLAAQRWWPFPGPYQNAQLSGRFCQRAQ
jgi:kumamolisin